MGKETEPMSELTAEQLVAEAQRFCMHCKGCGQVAVPQLAQGNPVDHVRQFVADHRHCVSKLRGGPVLVRQ
jgi:hypothetical protein